MDALHISSLWYCFFVALSSQTLLHKTHLCAHTQMHTHTHQSRTSYVLVCKGGYMLPNLKFVFLKIKQGTVGAPLGKLFKEFVLKLLPTSHHMYLAKHFPISCFKNYFCQFKECCIKPICTFYFTNFFWYSLTIADCEIKEWKHFRFQLIWIDSFHKGCSNSFFHQQSVGSHIFTG